MALRFLPNKLKYDSIQALFNKIRCIHTGQVRNDEEVTFIKKHNTLSESRKKEIEEEVKETTKNWFSYGFSITDKDADRYHFSFINILLVSFFGGTMVFSLIFLPKPRDKDWVMREAYIELHRREKLGLELIDRNFIPLERIVLPPEELLGHYKPVI